VHLAWDGVLGGNRNDPAQWRNVSATMELLEIAKRVQAKSFIGLGSQAEYGPCENQIDELCPTHPTTMYGASKLAAQQLSERFCAVNGLRYVWLRLFSSFGPMDNPDWLIPYLTRSLIAKEKPKLTAAEQLWDYIYIEDVASAIRAVLDSSDANGVFNVGSGKAYKLKNIIEKIRDLIDVELPLGFNEVEYRADQVMYLQSNILKLNAATGWLPIADIDLAIKKTVEWYLREP
jgi:nucleoside-diphosphate-sugar epimerase